MRAIIKSSDTTMLSAVRAVGGLVEPEPVPPAENPFAALEGRIAHLEDMLAKRERDIDRLQNEVKTARAEGEATGRKHGREEAENREADRIVLLEEATEWARARFADYLADTESLAAILTRECLGKLFQEPGFRGDAVIAILKAQMTRLEAKTLVSIRVSAEDFSDESLAVMAHRLGIEDISIERDSELSAGGCVLKPRLGEIDVGLETQWRAVRALLDSIAGMGTEEAQP